jgi:hypothetical protein
LDAGHYHRAEANATCGDSPLSTAIQIQGDPSTDYDDDHPKN